MATQVGADTRNTQYSVQVFLYDKKSKFTAAKVCVEMGIDMTIPVFGVFDKARVKSVFSATETS